MTIMVQKKFAHLREELLAKEEHALHVDIKNVVPFLNGGLQQSVLVYDAEVKERGAKTVTRGR